MALQSWVEGRGVACKARQIYLQPATAPHLAAPPHNLWEGAREGGGNGWSRGPASPGPAVLEPTGVDGGWAGGRVVKWSGSRVIGWSGGQVVG